VIANAVAIRWRFLEKEKPPRKAAFQFNANLSAL
jgi:hypothetical protein